LRRDVQRNIRSAGIRSPGWRVSHTRQYRTGSTRPEWFPCRHRSRPSKSRRIDLLLVLKSTRMGKTQPRRKSNHRTTLFLDPRHQPLRTTALQPRISGGRARLSKTSTANGHELTRTRKPNFCHTVTESPTYWLWELSTNL